MKILITGGDGFLAKSLFEVFSNEYTVLSCNRQDLNLLDYQKVSDYLKDKKFDVVIHTANYAAALASSTKIPEKRLENNLKMFFNLAKCRDYFGKMLYFGSGAEFDHEHWRPKMNETYFGQHVPTEQYGFSKYIMTQYALLSSNIYNFRLFSVFGKYDDWRYRFIPSSCCKAILDLSIIIKQNRFFDSLYIDDLVKIVRWFIQQQPKKHAYNVCAGVSYELKTLAEKIGEIAGKSLDIRVENQELANEYSGDNTLLLNEMKDFEFCSIDAAIKDLYGWYQSNQWLIKKDQLSYNRFII